MLIVVSLVLLNFYGVEWNDIEVNTVDGERVIFFQVATLVWRMPLPNGNSNDGNESNYHDRQAASQHGRPAWFEEQADKS